MSRPTLAIATVSSSIAALLPIQVTHTPKVTKKQNNNNYYYILLYIIYVLCSIVYTRIDILRDRLLLVVMYVRNQLYCTLFSYLLTAC